MKDVTYFVLWTLVNLLDDSIKNARKQESKVLRKYISLIQTKLKKLSLTQFERKFYHKLYIFQWIFINGMENNIICNIFFKTKIEKDIDIFIFKNFRQFQNIQF